jgi:hypothetical protein
LNKAGISIFFVTPSESFRCVGAVKVVGAVGVLLKEKKRKGWELYDFNDETSHI